MPRAAPLRQHQNSSPGRGVERPRRGGGELDSLATVLRLIRSGAAETRHEIEMLSGLGRAVIVDRIATLTAWRLVDEGDLAPSQGGRAPRQVRFRAEAGYVLVGAIGNMSLGVGLADLSGRLIVEHHERSGIGIGAGHTLDRLEELFDWMLAEHPEARDVWGIGLAVTGPVELPTGERARKASSTLRPTGVSIQSPNACAPASILRFGLTTMRISWRWASCARVAGSGARTSFSSRSEPASAWAYALMARSIAGRAATQVTSAIPSSLTTERCADAATLDA